MDRLYLLIEGGGGWQMIEGGLKGERTGLQLNYENKSDCIVFVFFYFLKKHANIFLYIKML